MSKERIFISSTGRTATQFFAKHFNSMIENSVSLHEPGTPWFSKPKKLIGQIRDYGLYHLTLGQRKNNHSMYKLSRDYVAGDINKDKACENILTINNKVDKLCGDAQTVVYSSGHIYGLLGLLDQLYEDSRFIFIVRDPREWIGSALNKTEYSLYGPIELILHKLSLQPCCIDEDPYAKVWKKLSKFEKYCWFYNKLNELVLLEMEHKSNFKVFKYEDILLSDDKIENFKSMLDFATDFQSGKIEYTFNPAVLGKKVDSKQAKAVAWKDWTDNQVEIMNKHCGDMMERFGYGTEEEWKNKLK